MTATQYMPPAPQTPAPRRAGLAISALIVGIVAFLTGWVPFLGIVLGLAGVLLGILALTQKQSKGLALTGLALASVAFLASVIVTVAVFNAPATSQAGEEPAIAEQAADDTTPVEEAPEAADTPAEPDESRSFSNGVFLVGKDVPPGNYSTSDASEFCYYAWKSGPEANAEIIDYNLLSDGGSATVTLEDGQVFDSTRCGTWTMQ